MGKKASDLRKEVLEKLERGGRQFGGNWGLSWGSQKDHECEQSGDPC